MKRYLLLLALVGLSGLAIPALAGDGHAASANGVNGDVHIHQKDTIQAMGSTTLWVSLDRLLGSTTASSPQPAAMYIGGGHTSGYAISARTCELLGREAELFKSSLDTGEYTHADLSEASVTEHAKQAGIDQYTPAFWTITTSRMVATNPINAEMPPAKMGKKMYDMCMHKFLGEEIAYQ